MQDAYGRDIRAQLGGRSQASGLLCPKCGGGSAKERSLSAWCDGLRLKAHCWRNKCRFSLGWLVTEEMGAFFRTRPPERRVYHVNTLPLSDELVARLEARYRLLPATVQHWGLRQTPGSWGVYVPVMSPGGYQRGVVRRRLDGQLPKVQGFPSTTEGAWQGWFTCRPGEGVLCVEDVFSALRLWQAGYNAVALLGTSITPTKVVELRKHTDDVTIVLDADAASTAIAAGIRYSVAVRALLGRDIKDMTEEQLRAWIESLHL